MKRRAQNAERMAKLQYIHPKATVVGDVKLGKNVSIWPGAVLRGDFHKIEVGDYTNVQDNAILHGSHTKPAIVGSNVSIGHGAIVHGCTIGNYVLVGMGAIILSGAKIPDNCFIGAGALVPEDAKLESGVYIGVPAQKFRNMKKGDHEYIRKNALDYWKMAKRYMKKGIRTK